MALQDTLLGEMDVLLGGYTFGLRRGMSGITVSDDGHIYAMRDGGDNGFGYVWTLNLDNDRLTATCEHASGDIELRVVHHGPHFPGAFNKVLLLC